MGLRAASKSFEGKQSQFLRSALENFWLYAVVSCLVLICLRAIFGRRSGNESWLRVIMNVMKSYFALGYCVVYRVAGLSMAKNCMDFATDARPSISFGGCAFWWPYMCGVCQYIFENFDLTDVNMFCCSASAFPVACTAVGVNPIQWLTKDYPKCLKHWNSRTLSCFLDSPAFLRNLWLSFLPPNANEIVRDRLILSVTHVDHCQWWKFPKLRNEQVSHFESNEDFVNCLLSTICIPGAFFRELPRVRGHFGADGGFTVPDFDPGSGCILVDVSPFGNGDIKPSKSLPWLWLLTPQSMERTLKMVECGYKDAQAKHGLFETRGWRPKHASPTRTNATNPTSATLAHKFQANACSPLDPAKDYGLMMGS